MHRSATNKQTAASGSTAIHDNSVVYHPTTGYKAVQSFRSPQSSLLFRRSTTDFLLYYYLIKGYQSAKNMISLQLSMHATPAPGCCRYMHGVLQKESTTKILYQNYMNKHLRVQMCT